ncbi:hypothetical protein HU200_024746 [Digitaria exilis]|uniref:Uncharacterized protein n=1 Tax=Digitaria exilis TaxID=1010633 RepID=A0A835EX54_9POAL|nr:hypothetical protein HU200_024746 [Digitaria exilis]
MDATLLRKKAPPAVTADDAAPSSAQQAVEPPLPSPSPGVKTTGVEDDDEQVEKFYALLENIRAMRGMVGGAATAAAERKRAREAEPPWRPAFRMEDFELEEVRSGEAAPCCDANSKRTKRESSRGARQRRPAAGKEATDGEEESEVVEATDPRAAQRKQARRAGVLSVDS